ncbi:hypothetical protein PCE1_001405 [Barthelona sp. PCE]
MNLTNRLLAASVSLGLIVILIISRFIAKHVESRKKAVSLTPKDESDSPLTQSPINAVRSMSGLNIAKVKADSHPNFLGRLTGYHDKVATVSCFLPKTSAKIRSFICSLTERGELRLWIDVLTTTQRHSRVMLDHPEPSMLELSDNGFFAFVAGYRDLMCVDLRAVAKQQDNHVVWHMHHFTPSFIVDISATDDYIAVACSTCILVVERETSRVVLEEKAPHLEIGAMKLTKVHGRTYLLIGSPSGEVELFSISTTHGAHVCTFVALLHTFNTGVKMFDLKNSTFAAISYAADVCVWNMDVELHYNERPKCVLDRSDHSNSEIANIRISPDEQKLAMGMNREVQILQIDTSHVVNELSNIPAYNVQWFGNDMLLAYEAEKRVNIFSTN